MCRGVGVVVLPNGDQKKKKMLENSKSTRSLGGTKPGSTTFLGRNLEEEKLVGFVLSCSTHRTGIAGWCRDFPGLSFATGVNKSKLVRLYRQLAPVFLCSTF